MISRCNLIIRRGRLMRHALGGGTNCPRPSQHVDPTTIGASPPTSPERITPFTALTAGRDVTKQPTCHNHGEVSVSMTGDRRSTGDGDTGVANTGNGAQRPTLASAFDPKRNNINALRLVLATAVLISHSWLFVLGEHDPLADLGAGMDVGELAVDGFFLLSGFLITRSYLRASSNGRYLWHRFLRIMPAFWVCLVVTATVAGPLLWWLEHDSTAGYPWAGEDSALTYVASNAALRMNQFNIGDLHGGGAVDGSLHTLYFEALCYIMIGILGTLGILRRRRVVVLALAAACWAVAVVDIFAGAELLAESFTLRFVSVFLVGSAMFLYADRIPVSRLLLGVSVVLLALALVIHDGYPALGPAPLAYLLLCAGCGHRLSRVGSRRDLSYGIYIYAWPVQLLLLGAHIGDGNLAVHAITSLGAVSLVAMLSWYLVEAPALSSKNLSPAKMRMAVGAISATGARRAARMWPARKAAPAGTDPEPVPEPAGVADGSVHPGSPPGA
jgi:peptidoglycan/LPS O-acetylase OafA/YrhL